MAPGYLGPLDPDATEKKHKRDSIGRSLRRAELTENSPEGKLLSEKIQDRLASQSEFTCADVELTVEKGIVVLTGSVKSTRERANLEGFIRSMDGVAEVINHLEIDKDSDLSKSISGNDDIILKA